MTIKSYKVRFYQGLVGKKQKSVAEIFLEASTALDANQAMPIFDLGDYAYQLRECKSINNGAVFKGAFGKLRDDAPHIVKNGGQEKAINLDEDEHLLEKNYFLYIKAQRLLVYQVNQPGGVASRLAQYLTAYTEGRSMVTFADVLRPSALTKLLNGDVRSVDVAFARPKKLKDIAPATNWNKNMMGMLKGAGAGRIAVKVSTQGAGQALLGEIKESVKELLTWDETRRLKIKLTDIAEPIDLIAECIHDTIEVAMDGRYPKPVSVYSSLEKARKNQQSDIDATLGTT